LRKRSRRRDPRRPNLKAEAKEKRPPRDEKQRLKKIAEEIDDILEFEDTEPADADIKKTIKDVPEPKKKKKKRGFW
jgi:hypothetical protein